MNPQVSQRKGKRGDTSELSFQIWPLYKKTKALLENPNEFLFRSHQSELGHLATPVCKEWESKNLGVSSLYSEWQ